MVLGGETGRSNSAFQPHKFTSYERDQSGADDAVMRRYNRWWSRFDQPDPYDGSYELSDPQSLNRYAYTGNDPVNFVDPSGLDGEFTIYWGMNPNGTIGTKFNIDGGSSNAWTGLGPGGGGGGGGHFGGIEIASEGNNILDAPRRSYVRCVKYVIA